MRHWLVLPVALVLIASGCSSVPPSVEPATEIWRINGKLGVRSPDYSGSFSVTWEQRDETYQVRLYSPLGITVARIEGDHQQATLSLPRRPQETFSQAHTESLLGYALPVAHLVYWLRGAPNPSEPHGNSELGFKQAGWQVDYLQYEDDRPSRIKVANGLTTLTMVIREWREE